MSCLCFWSTAAKCCSTALVKIVGPGSQHASEYEGIISQVTANAIQNLFWRSATILIQAILCVRGAFGPHKRGSGFAGAGVLPGNGTQGVIQAAAHSVCRCPLRAPRCCPRTRTVPITRMSSMVIPLALMAGSAAARILFRRRRHSLRRPARIGVAGARHDDRSWAAGIASPGSERIAILVCDAEGLSPYPGGRCHWRNALGCVRRRG